LSASRSLYRIEPTITTWPEPARGGGPGAKLRYETNEPLEKLNRREHELGAAVGRGLGYPIFGG
jgi:hypothetical protein